MFELACMSSEIEWLVNEVRQQTKGETFVSRRYTFLATEKRVETAEKKVEAYGTAMQDKIEWLLSPVE